MFMQIVFGIIAVWALIMFSGKVVSIINRSLGMVDKGVGTAELYIDEWQQEVEARIKTKAQLNAEAREEELNSLNELRTKAGKKALEVE